MLKDYLNLELFESNVEKKAPRDGFGEGMLMAGEKYENIVALVADLKDSMRLTKFEERFPERFVEMGVSEQNMISVASGLAASGKIPFAASYAVFSPGRTWEHLKVSVAINNVPVQIVGGHAGFSAGPYGSTHQSLEDIGLIRILPNMRVLSPCDYEETKKAVLAMADDPKPTYIRFEKFETPMITTKETPFEIGKGQIMWESKDPQVGIIATGSSLYEAILAAKDLDERGIESIVVNIHTIKPLDIDLINRVSRMTGCLVTVENHQIAGGLGSLVSETLIQNGPVPIEIVAVEDSFGESGEPDELKKKHGLTRENIVDRAKKAILRKTS